MLSVKTWSIRTKHVHLKLVPTILYLKNYRHTNIYNINAPGSDGELNGEANKRNEKKKTKKKTSLKLISTI